MRLGANARSFLFRQIHKRQNGMTTTSKLQSSQKLESIFISYRKKDSTTATGRVYDRLVTSFGVDNVFKDVFRIPLGVNFMEHLVRALNRCQVVLVIIGKTWLTATDEEGNRRLDKHDDVLRLEIETALKQEIPIIPVLLEGARMPSESELPDSLQPLATIQAALVGEDPRFTSDMERLIEAIRGLPGWREYPIFYYTDSKPRLPKLFLGREREFQSVKDKLLGEDGCSVLPILGPGGIGKTTLAVMVSEDRDICREFEKVIYFSLSNPISPIEFSRTAIKVISKNQEVDISENFDISLTKLLNLLRRSKCLIVLDNYQSVFELGGEPGKHAKDFIDYGKFLQKVVEERHLSTVLIASREKPKLLDAYNLEDLSSPMLIEGINSNAARSMIDVKDDLHILDECAVDDWDEFVYFLQGNPLLILLTSAYVRDDYEGNISEYLRAEEARPASTIPGFLDELLDKRFSTYEKEVFLWMTVNREPVTIDVLQKDTIFLSRERIRTALGRLQRRYVIEKINSSKKGEYYLPPAILEHTTSYIVEIIRHELRGEEEVYLLNRLCLLKAESREYIRESQARYIVSPISDEIRHNYSGISARESYIRDIFCRHRETLADSDGYFSGNILDILLNLELDIRGWDFSNTHIRQAYLRGVTLKEVDFSGCNFHDSVFFETFDSLLDTKFSPDGRLFAASDSNGDVHIWNTEDSAPFIRFSGHGNYVRTIAFSHRGDTLVSAGSDSRIIFWSIDTREPTLEIRDSTNRIWSVEFTANDRYLISGGSDRSLKLWDTRTRDRLIRSIDEAHQSEIKSVSYSQERGLIASASTDKTVKVWSADLSECVLTLAVHQSAVWNCKFSPDGKIIASADEDGNIILHDTETGSLIASFKYDNSRVRAIDFNRDGQLLACGNDSGTVCLWDIKTGERKTVMNSSSKDWIWSVAFSPDDSTIIGVSEDRSLQAWNAASGKLLRALRGYTNVPVRLAFSPSCQYLASGHQDSKIYIWDYIRGGSPIRTVDGGKNGHKSAVISIEFSSQDENLLVSGSKDCTVKVWDVSNMKRVRHVRTFEGHTDQIWAVTFSPDRKLIASGSNDLTVRIWDMDSGNPLHILSRHEKWIWSIAFSPNGNILASGSDDGMVVLWDVRSGELLRVLEGQSKQPWALYFSGDGKFLSSGSGNGNEVICTWDVESGNLTRSLPEASKQLGQIWTAGFSPDGKVLANTSEINNYIHVWDAETGRYRGSIGGPKASIGSSDAGHSKQPWTVVLSYPDGQIAASSSFDQSIKIWDIDSGTCLHTLQVPGPYDGMNIIDAEGLNDAEVKILTLLGAIA